MQPPSCPPTTILWLGISWFTNVFGAIKTSFPILMPPSRVALSPIYTLSPISGAPGCFSQLTPKLLASFMRTLIHNACSSVTVYYIYFFRFISTFLFHKISLLRHPPFYPTLVFNKSPNCLSMLLNANTDETAFFYISLHRSIRILILSPQYFI